MTLNPALLSAMALGVAATAAPAATIFSDPADQESTSAGTVGAPTNTTILAGAYYGGGPGTVPVFVFQLPTLGPSESFATATVTLNLAFITGTPTFNGDLVGLSRVTASNAVLGTDFAEAGTLIQDNIFTPASATGLTTSVDFAPWLNTQYAGGTNAGNYVFIKVDAEGTSSGGYVGYNINSGNVANDALKPTLTYTVIPEPSSLILLGLGGLGFAIRRRRHA